MRSMSKRGKHPFDGWDLAACIVACGLAVLGVAAISAGFVMLVERIVP